jgi:subtilisin family serine protease
MRRLAVVVAGVALALPGQAAAGRFALGIEAGHSAERVAARVEAATGSRVTIIGPFAVAVQAPSARGLAQVRGVSYVERVRPVRTLSFIPNDPLVVRQWYLRRVNAFEAWPKLPLLTPAKVAILDSGIDASHPELRGSIANGRSFVPGRSWRADLNGHGTFVAGQIAAAVNNSVGIAGLAFHADLLIAKVVRPDGTISPEAEARAIRWAVDEGAHVINISFGGIRSPHDSGRDTYSALEAAAVAYAVRKDVLVVAAVGNGDKAPWSPWDFANYPAALPHVLGVSAIARDGSVPEFSNRDELFNDIAAPGEEIFSTLPLATTDRFGCALQGYSDCGPAMFRRGEGTSFAAPLVSAAAAVVLGERPGLQADQVAAILQRSARDAVAASGCRRCPVGRDPLTGSGVVDVAAAVDLLSAPPVPDWREPNDDAGKRARMVWGRRQSIVATLDYWNDSTDVYRIRLRRGQKVRAVMRRVGLGGAETSLLLWRPGTKRIGELPDNSRRLAASDEQGPFEVVHRAPRRGDYFLQVSLSTPVAGSYRLTFEKTPLKRRRGARRPARSGSSGPGSRP